MRTAAVSSSILLVLVSCSAPASRAPRARRLLRWVDESDGTRAGALEMGDPYYPAWAMAATTPSTTGSISTSTSRATSSPRTRPCARGAAGPRKLRARSLRPDVTAVSVDGASATFERAGLVEGSDGKPPVATELACGPRAALERDRVRGAGRLPRLAGRPARSLGPDASRWRAAESGVFVASECAERLRGIRATTIRATRPPTSST
jgi:hypothetical protein